MIHPFKLVPVGTLLILGGCATMPSGPSVMVLPGTGKSFAQFRADEYVCRQFAQDVVSGVDPNRSAVGSAVVGAAVGTVAGAVIGGERGAAVGAGTGLIVGSAAGTDTARWSAYGMQRQYDISYLQCMYAKGNQVPVEGRFRSSSQMMNQMPPPPPPGPPPPPPPGY